MCVWTHVLRVPDKPALNWTSRGAQHLCGSSTEARESGARHQGPLIEGSVLKDHRKSSVLFCRRPRQGTRKRPGKNASVGERSRQTLELISPEDAFV